MFIVGCALTEFAGYMIMNHEAVKDYSSIQYHVYIGIFTSGITLSLTSIFPLHQRAEKYSERVSAEYYLKKVIEEQQKWDT